MPFVVLYNPISGRGHLDAYARLYARAFLENGCSVLLLARTDGGVVDYIGRNLPHLASQLSFVSLREAEDAATSAAPDSDPELPRGALPAHRRALLVLQEEGVGGILRRLVVVPKRVLLRWTSPWLRKQAKLLRADLRLRLHRWLNPDAGRLSFITTAAALRGATKITGRRPDLVFNLYLDMMGERRRSLAALDGPDAGPWAGVLFHPRRAERGAAREEAYFASRKARGGIFLVPHAIPVYAGTRPSLHFALAPDVADLECAATPHVLADAMRRQAAGRTTVLLIGSITPHKGIMTFLDMVERADPSRFFFAVIGEAHWESFGTDAPRLRAFFASPPENVLVHEGYVAEERDYNTVIEAADVIYAVYDGFNSSSNSLTKAAGLKRRILVTEDTLMGRRVQEARLGATAPTRDPVGILQALTTLADKPLDAFDFAGYAEAHSLGELQRVLAAAIPHWTSSPAKA